MSARCENTCCFIPLFENAYILIYSLFTSLPLVLWTACTSMHAPSSDLLGGTNTASSQVNVPIDDLSLSERMHRMLEPDQIQRLRKVMGGWGGDGVGWWCMCVLEILVGSGIIAVVIV